MTRAQKAATIAQEYVDLHRDKDLSNWQPLALTGNNKLLRIYDNLIAGEYGEVHIEDKSSGALSVEIPSRDTAAGNPIIFEWEDAEHTQG